MPLNNGDNEGYSVAESEAGARLALHLLLKLFRTVECFQPNFYTIASPRSIPVSAHDTGWIFKFCYEIGLFGLLRSTSPPPPFSTFFLTNKEVGLGKKGRGIHLVLP